LNKSLLVNNTELTVVGVAQAGFTGIQVGNPPISSFPLMMKAQMTPERNGLEEWNNYVAAVFARRKPGCRLRKRKRASMRPYRLCCRSRLGQIKSWGPEKRQKFLDKADLAGFWSERSNTLQHDSGEALTALFVMVALVLC